MTTTTKARTASGMPQTATHDAEARPMIAGAEARVWTERMHPRELACALPALVNGVVVAKHAFGMVAKHAFGMTAANGSV